MLSFRANNRAPPVSTANRFTVKIVKSDDWVSTKASLTKQELAAATLARFRGEPGAHILVTTEDGELRGVVAGVTGPSSLRGLSARLPDGDYVLEPWPAGFEPDRVAIEWAAGLYRFDRYKGEATAGRPRPRLNIPASPRAQAISNACILARDLINTPANHMGPAELEAAARAIAEQHDAEVRVTVGDGLIAEYYPAVHAVGRAAHPDRASRIIEMTWGSEAHPIVAVIGKGVVFDTGGLDIKASSGMRWMKKDMGGAAHALALASMIMTLRLPVRLCVLLPVVENAISGDAMRPGDILSTRKGLSVEVGNTDAEGRLILADALTRAAELEPELTLDLATLTGAARVALGPDLPPFYTDDEALAADLIEASRVSGDPLWRMPLWSDYEQALDSDIADIKNDADAWAQAGSVMAALFLKRFAPKGSWAHFDIFAWNPRSRPGWPQGGEAQAIRAIFTMLEKRYPV